MAVLTRLRQGLRALAAFSRPVDNALVDSYLSPPLAALFRRMRKSEQLHSLNVLKDILAQGETPADLAVAALLHDVGKTRFPIVLWQRTLPVLVPLVAPALARRWQAGSPAIPWQRPFVVKAQHPHWSAEMIASAGASDLAAWLARHHQDAAEMWINHPNFPLLQRLQDADDAN